MLIAWLILGALLLLFEMHHLAFFAMFGAIGSLAAAVVAVLAPEAIALQAGVALGVSAVGVVAGRPFVSRAIDLRQSGFSVKGVHGGLVGHEAITLDDVGDAHRVGHVRLTGERWLAVSGSGQVLPEGTVVVVTAVQGSTLVVWPVDGIHDLDAIGGGDVDAIGPASSDSDHAPNGADGRTS